ncbi:MAG: DUF3750 domain-containing protein [Burkholderiales bacterium]
MRFSRLPLVLAVFALCACAAQRATLDSGSEVARLAPDPSKTPEAVIQVYGARTVGAKGVFGVHTWVAVKPHGERAYTVYEVIGWRQRYGASPVVIHQRTPDARWFGAQPELIAYRRGKGTEELIAKIDKAAREYPWANEYSVWPGPNSNTFTAWIGRAVPELRLDLPPTAIGKDYSGSKVLGAAPSGSGLQFSLFGLFGLTASPVEGIELNLLGLTLGANPFDFSLKLPLVGRVGFERAFDTK